MATKTVASKSDKVKAIPDGYHSVTPYLIIDGAARALDFYKRAFDAKELMRIPAPNDKIGHAEIRIGDSAVSIMVYLEDVDKQFKQAIAAGATAVRPIADQFYGDRSGTLKDPFGHSRHLSTHKEDVSIEEMNRRMAALKK